MTPTNKDTEALRKKLCKIAGWQYSQGWVFDRQGEKLNITHKLDGLEKLIEGCIATATAEAEARGELKIWKELKRGEGFYTNESGCREVHVDYIDERIELAQKKRHEQGAKR